MAPLGLGTGFYRLGPALDQSANICGPDMFDGRWGADGEVDGPKLLHWYKFRTGITTNGTGVIRWDDQKGSNHLVPAATDDANEQPELVADGTIRFQQNTDSLVFGSALSLGTFSIYFVHKFRLGETVSSEVMFEGSADSLKLASANEARWKCSSRQDFDIPSENQIDEDKKYVFGVERASNGDVAMYKDNIALLAKDGDDLNEAISTTFDLTQVGDPNGDSQWYEIVIIDKSLTTEQRNCLYSYLLSVE
tara:strand:- start:556 stop:1305 length:750 start_codon:yes stop_codon:yes gene_type:complete